MLLVVVSVYLVLPITLVVMAAVVVITAVMVFVNDRVPPAAGDEVAVDREGRHECHGQSYR